MLPSRPFSPRYRTHILSTGTVFYVKKKKKKKKKKAPNSLDWKVPWLKVAPTNAAPTTEINLKSNCM